MPIYEHTCRDCQTDFELIHQIKDADSGLMCTDCESSNVTRRISLFNASSGGRSFPGSSGCGNCAGGSCSTCGTQ